MKSTDRTMTGASAPGQTANRPANPKDDRTGQHTATTRPSRRGGALGRPPLMRRGVTVTGALGVVVAGLLIGSAPPASGTASAHHPQRPHRTSADVVTDWNRIAFRTYGQGTSAVPPPVQALYSGFVGAAVHDAVVSIMGRSRPYLPHGRSDTRRPRGASVEAAASTAAYRVLSALVPTATEQLAADHARWLAQVPDGPRERAGVRAGERAAQALLRARKGDGRGAPITLTTTPGPGVWDVPPGGMAVPWLGFVRTMVLPSATSIRLPGPDPLGSRRYARDVEEVQRMGGATGSDRTPAQTETALFYSANPVQQYNDALSDRLTRHGADASTAARHLALLGLASADAAITCWRTKYDVHNWRPQQAIQRADDDGNPRTVADPTWQPLLANPPYPDYTSGHACVTGAASRTLARLYGPSSIDITVASPVTGTTRHYDRASRLVADTTNARIWLGIHFRKAMDDGSRIGTTAADVTVDRMLRPTRR